LVLVAKGGVNLKYESPSLSIYSYISLWICSELCFMWCKMCAKWDLLICKTYLWYSFMLVWCKKLNYCVWYMCWLMICYFSLYCCDISCHMLNVLLLITLMHHVLYAMI
jgi:hypothetical protein